MTVRAGVLWCAFAGTCLQPLASQSDRLDSYEVKRIQERADYTFTNLVAYLDTPLPSDAGYERRGPVVSRGQNVIVFDMLGKPRDFVDESGYVRFLPTMDLLLLYSAEDRDLRAPLWVSRSLRR